MGSSLIQPGAAVIFSAEQWEKRRKLFS